MPIHKETRHSPHSSAQLFALVADVERYPEFLPWCRAARILRRDASRIEAELVINFKNITESYISDVRLFPPETARSAAAIRVTMIRGPFRHLVNHWEFTPTPEGGTEVDFMLDFAFTSRLLEMLIGGLFTRATQKMTAAFEKRADDLYKKTA